jgi:hypothetical protein
MFSQRPLRNPPGAYLLHSRRDITNRRFLPGLILQKQHANSNAPRPNKHWHVTPRTGVGQILTASSTTMCGNGKREVMDESR